MSFLRAVLSTITSPTFSKIVIIYREHDFGSVTLRPRVAPKVYKTITPAEKAEEASRHRRLFEAFQEMYKVRRDFQLVLCAEVWDYVGKYAVRVLEQAVATENAEARLDYEPLVVRSPQGFPDGPSV